MKIVLICGSRYWTNQGKISRRMKLQPRDTMIIEGGAPGADCIAGEVADELGLPHAKVEANWNFYKKAAGAVRNRWMLNLKPTLVIGFHSNLAESKGTKDCIEEAQRRGILTEIID